MPQSWGSNSRSEWIRVGAPIRKVLESFVSETGDKKAALTFMKGAEAPWLT
jgi:hypothetical protein